MAVGHVKVFLEFRRKVALEQILADHRAALVAQILADVGEIDQPASRFQDAAMHLVVELKTCL
ncbi:MAG: hypothetical protein WC485_07115, partial [Opitutaceae bacterium]